MKKLFRIFYRPDSGCEWIALGGAGYSTHDAAVNRITHPRRGLYTAQSMGRFAGFDFVIAHPGQDKPTDDIW